jgi:membrane protease YdiL (CAAX protease family)
VTPDPDRRALGGFLLLALGSTAVLHGSIALLGLRFSLAPDSPALYLYLLGLATPSAVAIALSPGTAGRKRFLWEALRPRGSLRVHTFAVVAQLGFLALAATGAHLSGAPGSLHLSIASGFWLVAVGQLWVVLGEEIGWRGFALPRLERILSPRRATLVLALVWGVWHAPMFFVPGSLQAQAPPWLFAAAIFAWSCVHTALYQRSRPSVVPNLLFHACANVTLNLVALPAEARVHLFVAYLVGGLTILWFLVPAARRVA